MTFQVHGDHAIVTLEHHGLTIVHQYDVRGPQHDEFYDFVTVELDGEESTFNTVDDARDYINEMLDIPCEDHEEHRLRGWQLV